MPSGRPERQHQARTTIKQGSETISDTSFTNTPQATDDYCGYTEDELALLASGLMVTIDVTSNDLGGNAKSLFSIDDGNGNALDPSDLLNADGLVDGVSEWEATSLGNMVRINNGKLDLDLSHSVTALGGSDFLSLAAGDVISDSFVYAIRLANGTLSWAHVSFEVFGENDPATISGDTTGTICEDDTTPVTGRLVVTDPDHDESYSVAASGTTTHGTYSVDADGNWSFVLDNASVQYLNDNESVTDSFVVTSLDGTASQTVNVTINGADEDLSFVRTDISAGLGPISIAVDDLNGDRKLDMVVANGNSFSNDSVFLGNGNGTFQPRTEYTVGESHQVVLADLNGDGFLDMVNANSNSATASVSLGNGDGSFQSRVAYLAGNRPISVAVGDVNSDGALDIATANYGSNDASILLGNGNGTFQSPVNYSTGTQAGSVHLADLNSDGSLDMVVGNQISNSVSVLIGNGDGTFAAATDYVTDGGTTWTEVIDVNNDGKLDVVAALGALSKVAVMLGNGDGTFQTPLEYTTDDRPFFFASGDLDNDGNIDLVCASINDGNIAILRGNGDGSFDAPTHLATGAEPTSVAIADINDDGRNDIIVGNGSSNTVSIFMNDTDFIV